MIGASFLFLKENFPLIYQDCYRMEKNLVEGDGIESIMLSGRILERITKTIFEIEGFEYIESQFKRIQKLDNVNILTKDVKNNFNQIRILRNDVYHRDVASALNNKSNYTRTYMSKSGDNNKSTKSYLVSSHAKNYSSISNNGSDFGRISKSKGELNSAKQAHKIIFNICIWFYEEYGGNKSFIRPVYKIGKRPHDIDIMIRLKYALENSDDFKQLLVSTKEGNKIIELLKELRGLNKVNNSSSDNSNLVYKDNKNIKIRKPNKPYSECMGVSYDDELFMWKANYGSKELGLFNTSKEAYEARQLFLNSIPVPKLNSNGKFSNHVGISFSKINKMWTVSAKGQIVGYYPSEKSAIKNRDVYYKKHGIGIKYKNKQSNISFGDITDSNKSNDSTKYMYGGSKNKKSSKIKSTKHNPSSKLNYGNQYKKSVKVKEGKRISKPSKKAKKSVDLKRKASKYEGIYYEENLFMWSAEVDGKELGLFASEKEAKQKRDEYIKNKQ